MCLIRLASFYCFPLYFNTFHRFRQFIDVLLYHPQIRYQTGTEKESIQKAARLFSPGLLHFIFVSRLFLRLKDLPQDRPI